MIKPTDPRFFLRNIPWIVASLAMAAIAYVGAILQPPVPDPYAPSGRSFLGWLLSPIERNPHLRLPFTSAGLGSIVFSDDGRRGWVVGNNGTILRTEDGGETWDPRPVLLDDGTIVGLPDRGESPIDRIHGPYLWSVAMSSDGSTGWAVGQRGTVLRSTDGGETWEQRESGTRAWLRSVAFAPDDDTGWVVGDDGTFLVTEDGGETWTSRRIGTREDLTSVAFSAVGTAGWIVVADGTILTTRDGGQSWSVRETRASEHLNSSVFAPDGITAWAVGGRGTVLKTVDGGNTWAARSSGTSVELLSVAFTVAGDTGWAAGAEGVLLGTVDGGETWIPAASGTSAHLKSIHLSADGRTAWVAGARGTILVTEDGGESWFPRTRGASQFLGSVAFSADGDNGWAVGDDGTILETEDGGETWAPRASGTLADLRAVTFSADGSTGWATGDHGTILKTEDGGDTWSSRRSGTTQLLRDVYFLPDDRTGWAVGWERESQLLKTEDGGETWEPRDLGMRKRFNSVAFSTDGGTGWAVGDDGTILKTEDGGGSWQPRDSGTGDDLRSVTFLPDGTTGWAVGSGGTIVETRDAGETWRSRASGTDTWLNSVIFTTDGQAGWVVGGGGTILETIDGGETWTRRDSGHYEELRSVAFTGDGVRGWAVGRGAILLSVDTGIEWHRMNGKDDYHRYPAPWTWCLFLLALLLVLVPAFRRTGEFESDTPSHFSRDRPITAGEDDLLQRRPVAAALKSFLLNRNTEPPMSIAITGSWGEGKSSLMNLIHAEVEAEGARTVWFNAWHHQKEHHLFAALLHAVRDQAVPGLLSLRGIPFRIRLFVSRTSRNLIWAAAVLSLTAVAILLVDLDEVVATLTGMQSLEIDDIKDQLETLSDDTLGLVSLAIGVFIGIQSIIVSLKRTGVDPGNLMRTASRAMTVKVFGDQLGFRHRFAAAFKEVTDALGPNRLVIFIDDLDRCRPEQVVATLEAVNFLVSAGSCYVVMGIAPEQIMRCIGISFKEIAAELDDLDAESDASRKPEREERRKRRDYALNYMEKLINVEIPVPRLTEECVRRLVDLTIGDANSESQEPPPGRRGGLSGGIDRVLHALSKLLSNYAAVAALVTMEVLALVVTGLLLAGLLVESPPHPTVSSPILPEIVPNGVRGVPDDSTPGEEGQEGPSDDSGDEYAFYDSSPAGGPSQWTLIVPAALLLIAVAAAMVRYVFVRLNPHTRDSRQLIDALRIWLPWVLKSSTNSPRQAKRFINKSRYIAVMSREVETYLQRLSGAGRTNTTSGEAPDEKMEAPDRLSESLVVALVALQGCIGETDRRNGEYPLLLELAKVLAKNDFAAGSCSETTIESLFSRLQEASPSMLDKEAFRNAVERHRESFDNEYVSDSLVKQFADMASSFVMR